MRRRRTLLPVEGEHEEISSQKITPFHPKFPGRNRKTGRTDIYRKWRVPFSEH